MAFHTAASPQIAELGDGWAGSSVNVVPFRHHAVLPVGDSWIASFYNVAGAVVLCRLNAGFQLQAHRETPSLLQPHDAHTCISLERGPAGDIHAVFGAHASTAWHMRFTSDLSRSLQPPRELTHRHAERLTYPMLIRGVDPPELAMMYRDGGSWGGQVRISRWIEDEMAFVPDETPLISGIVGQLGAGPYLNRPVRMPDGRIAIFVVWRLAKELTSAGEVVNVGIDLVYADANLRSLATDDAVGLRLPVTPLHGARVWAVPPGRNLINQAGATSGPDGRPMAASYWNDEHGIPQYHLVWSAGQRWQASPISAFRTSFALGGWGTLPLPHSRPEILARDDGTVLCFFRSVEYDNRLMMSVHAPPHWFSSTMPRILVDEDLGHYEPVIDTQTFQQDGSVVLFVQGCHQGQGDGKQALRSAPVRLFRWSAAEVAAW